MKNLIVILATFLLISAGYNLTYAQVTQEWVQRYNGPENYPDKATSLAVDGSGNVYVTGVSGINPFTMSGNYSTIKYNSNGDSLWVKRYGGPGYDEATSIAVDDSGNVYVTGYSSGALYDYLTIKYSSSGVEQWVKRYNGPGNSNDRVASLAIDGSGNVYITGSSGNDYATIKYNSNGDSLWVQRFNGPGNGYDYATSLTVDLSNNVYVTGSSRGNGTGDDYATIKYNSNGDSLWVKRYKGGGEATSLTVDGSGNVYVTGSSPGIGTGYDYATIKYNSNGDSLWVKRYSGPGNDFDNARSIEIDGSGNVYVTGSSRGIGTNRDYATIKYNSNGDSLWVKRYNGSGNYDDLPASLAVDGSGNVYVTGSSSGYYATIKYNSNGDSLWVKRYSGDGATSLAVDGSGNVYVTGSSYADYVTIKYSSVPRTLYLTAFIEGFYNNVTNKMIRDTIRVYLRNSTVPYAIVDSAKTVLDTNGNGILNFFNATNSILYYIVVKHRNSIETWSSGGNSFLSNNLTYNFTTAANKAYGNNQKQIDSSPIQFGIYSGDVNQDGVVDGSDGAFIDNDAANFLSGYLVTDLNGDNFIDGSDALIADNNAANFVSVIRP